MILSVDGTREKPFRCEKCGDTYEPCAHWSEASRSTLTAREFYTIFMKATTQSAFLDFGELPLVHQAGWQAVEDAARVAKESA